MRILKDGHLSHNLPSCMFFLTLLEAITNSAATKSGSKQPSNGLRRRLITQRLKRTLTASLEIATTNSGVRRKRVVAQVCLAP